MHCRVIQSICGESFPCSFRGGFAYFAFRDFHVSLKHSYRFIDKKKVESHSLLIHLTSRKVERTEPFVRKIQPEEWWMYRNPPTADYVPGIWLLPMTFIMPFTVILINYCISRDRNDFSTANNVVTLAIALNGFTTSLLKVTVGRPRPDFYYRCYPNGTSSMEEKCYGDPYEIQEGRKSFPSGHSSCKYHTRVIFFF